jgi:hypothetical protein
VTRNFGRRFLAAIATTALVLVLTACSSSGAGTSPSAPAAASQAPAASGAPGASGACLDKAQLGDLGETVATAMQTMSDSLKTGNVDGAKSAAATTVSAMRALADYVAPAQAQGAQKLRDAADAVEKATTSFPGGADQISQAQSTLNAGFELAQGAGCPT